MGKRSPPTGPKGLELLRQDIRRLAAQWLPKGAAQLEKQALQAQRRLQEYRQHRQQVVARKARLLWLLPLPMIPATMIALASGNFLVFMGNLAASGLFLTGALLTRHGFVQEANQNRQQFQVSRQIPLKSLGCLSISLATALTAWIGVGHSLPIALAFGAGAFAAFVLLYGFDPRPRPAAVKTPYASSERVTKALQQAERMILDIEQAGGQITQPELNQRLTRIVSLARDILGEIARDPSDLQRARKFLNTYLEGTQRVVTGYAQSHTQDQTRILEPNFRRILGTIEEVFGQQYQRLRENDLRDLDVQMEVLETQLKREGLN